MHVGDHCTPGLEAIDPGQCVVDAEVARMRHVAQAVGRSRDRDFQRVPALARDVADVGCIGGVADAIAERRNVCRVHVEGGQREGAALPFDAAALAALDRMLGQDRRIVAARRRD